MRAVAVELFQEGLLSVESQSGVWLLKPVGRERL